MAKCEKHQVIELGCLDCTAQLINEKYTLQSERDTLLTTLATERDAFGKKETELMAEVKRMGKIAYQYEHDIDALSQEVKRLREVLEKIAQDATFPIKAMDVAKQSLSSPGEAKKDEGGGD